MTATHGAVAARAASATASVRLSRTDRLAEHMAEGCPSATEAARRMRITVDEARRIWARIVRDLGPQAS